MPGGAQKNLAEALPHTGPRIKVLGRVRRPPGVAVDVARGWARKSQRRSTFVMWIGTEEAGKVKAFMPFRSGFITFILVGLGWSSFCLGQSSPLPLAGSSQQRAQQISQQNSEQNSQQGPEQERIATWATPSAGVPNEHLPGSISGTVVDQSGAVVAGARVRLTEKDPSLTQETQSGSDGEFSFARIEPGPFQLTVTSAGFAPQTTSGILHSQETYVLPQIALAVASNNSEVEVTLTRTELAEKEIKIEEKQRVLGIVPNFYVSYLRDAVPLTPKQKFEIAWKTVIDPVTIVIVGASAGVEQAQNHFAEYGQGAQGYAKRFGANYGDTFTGTFIGAAVLPSLLKQDPRYFYKGTGTIRARFMYAVANAFICKGDNGHWQPNYSNVLGSLAAGGISNLYYPAQDRDGATLTFENAAIGLGASAVSNLFQEFFIRKFTPRVPKNPPGNP